MEIASVLFISLAAVVALVATVGILNHKVANLKWNIRELEDEIKYKDKCIEAARNRQPAPFPLGRKIKEGFVPYGSQKYKDAGSRADGRTNSN